MRSSFPHQRTLDATHEYLLGGNFLHFLAKHLLPVPSSVTFSLSPALHDSLAERLIEESVDGIFAFDRQQCYTLWNPAMEQLFGLRAERVLGCHVSEIFPAFAKSGMDRDYARALQGEVVNPDALPFHMEETGRSGHINIRYIPLTNRYGYVTEVLAIVRDVTREYQEHIERRKKIDPPPPYTPPPQFADPTAATILEPKDDHVPGAVVVPSSDELIATTAHELRTPINAILGYIEILTRELAGPLTLTQHEHLGHISMSAKHLLTVANRVLELAKAEATATVEVLTVRQQRSSISKVLEAAFILVQPQAAERNVLLSSGIDSALDVWYYADPDLVRQILVNLLSNAVKFTPPGGRVVVFAGEATETNSDGVFVRNCTYIRVDDTGIGIPPDQLATIFEPFVQGSSPNRKSSDLSARGTGLGLTISRRLARLMGGDVTATSTINVGSRFTLWLPADETSLIRT